jgi:hypothetical protein
MKTEGKIFTTIRVAGQSLDHNFIVCPELNFSCILGLDLLRRLNCHLDLTSLQLIGVPDRGQTSYNNSESAVEQVFSISLTSPCEEDIEALLPSTNATTAPQLRERLKALIFRCSNAFAWRDSQLGRTKLLCHEINTGDSPPIRVPPRRIPAALVPEVTKMLDEMLRNNVIQQSNSPWAAPVVLVKKKDGTLRMCVDYRRLNQVTRPDAFPMPRVDELFDALAGAKYFSTLDLASGYWQVEVDEKDRPKTAFSVASGLYEFQTMPFGLINAPATFQRLMQKALQDFIPQMPRVLGRCCCPRKVSG